MRIEKLDKLFDKDKQKGMNPQALIQKEGFLYDYPRGSADKTFHAASVGKMFTTTLAGLLFEKDILQPDTRVTEHLSQGLLAKLFVYRGQDTKEQVTVMDLLSHRSCIADASEDRGRNGDTMMDQMLRDKDKPITPLDIIRFSQEEQSAFGPRGSFHYSDTGYTLLGLLLEQASGLPYHHLVHEWIFEPLGMDSSYLFGYSQPVRPSALALQPVIVNRQEMSGSRSVSMAWAGGGVVSSPRDLASFLSRLHEGALIRPDTLAMLQAPQGRMRRGIHYGAGFMELRFGELFFPLRSLPRLQGHSGVVASHLYRSPKNGAVLVLTYADSGKMGHSIQRLVQMTRALAE